MPKTVGLTMEQRACLVEERLFDKCVCLVEKNNLSYSDIAQACGISRQNLYHQRRVAHRFSIPVIATICSMAHADLNEIGETFRI